MKKRKGSSLFFVLLFGEAHLGISTFSKAENRNAVRPAGHFAICVRSLNCVAFSFLIEDRTDMLCMSISAPFGIYGKAIREAVCNQLAELRRKAHFEFSVNAHYIFSGESCDFCKAEITAFKTVGSESEREQHFLTFKMPRRAQSFSVNRLRFSEKLLSALFASRKEITPE